MKSGLINEIEKEVKKSENDEFNKAYSELFGEDLFEKAKHQIGDSHPKWPQLKWTDLGGGKFGWRTGTGKGKRGNTNTSSGGNAGNAGEQKDLSTHAKETDTKTLKNVANSDKAPKDLKDAAKKELQNRGEETETKEDKKLRPVGTGTNGPERRRRLAPHSTHAKTATEKKGENIEISSIKDKALREKITRYVEEATDGEYSESDYTWKDVLTALRNPSEKDVRASLEKKFGVTVDLASNDDEGKKKSENSDSMTAEQLFKKYNIPETTVEEINTKRGYEYDRRKVKSAKDGCGEFSFFFPS